MQQARAAEHDPLTRPPPAVQTALVEQMPLSLVVGDLQLSPATTGARTLNSPTL